jgi:CheY-like chemotaxis protein
MEINSVVQEPLNTVMVIDDSDLDLMFASIMLERAGIAAQLLTFSSAQQALDHLHGPQAGAVDLILLDINMPGMDGFEFLNAFEALPMRHPPVVMLSSSPDPADRLRALQHACVRCYVTKPINADMAAALPRCLAVRAAT